MTNIPIKRLSGKFTQLPEEIINQAHLLYKKLGFKYGRRGPILYPTSVFMAIEEDKWDLVCYHLAPEYFHECKIDPKTCLDKYK